MFLSKKIFIALMTYILSDHAFPGNQTHDFHMANTILQFGL